MTRLTILAEICKRFPLDALYVFGSRAQEVQRWVLGCKEALPSSASEVDIWNARTHMRAGGSSLLG